MREGGWRLLLLLLLVLLLIFERANSAVLALSVPFFLASSSLSSPFIMLQFSNLFLVQSHLDGGD